MTETVEEQMNHLDILRNKWNNDIRQKCEEMIKKKREQPKC